MNTEWTALLSGAIHRQIWAVLLTFFVSVLIGPLAIRALRALGVGQNINKLAPEMHQKKQGTPTMAGLMFAFVATVGAFALRVGPFRLANDLPLAISVFALLNLGIGFADDFTKLRGKDNQGLSERQKLIAQFLIALLFSWYCYRHPLVGSSIVIPYFNVEWDLGIFYIPVMVFVIICTTNGSNLLDGLDGLLGGVSAVITAFFAVAAMAVWAVAQQLDVEALANLQNVGILSAAACGALLGYLVYNLHPARMMMGDTGSMYLGGLVAALAMVLRIPILIPVVAAAYAVSLLSVFMQRWYFRLTGGKRIFKMSPLHHHFELMNIKETKIVSMYTLVTAVLCLIALLGVI